MTLLWKHCWLQFCKLPQVCDQNTWTDIPSYLSSPTENSGSIDGLNVKEWQDGLRALLPNININFGGLPNSSSSSSSSSSNSVNHIGGLGGPAGISHSLSWDGTASWMDPAIITGSKYLKSFSSWCGHWQSNLGFDLGFVEHSVNCDVRLKKKRNFHSHIEKQELSYVLHLKKNSQLFKTAVNQLRNLILLALNWILCFELDQIKHNLKNGPFAFFSIFRLLYWLLMEQN